MMDMLIDELVSLANDPRAWFAVLGLALATAHAFWAYRTCPMSRADFSVTPEIARQTVHGARNHSPRFVALMLVGIVATVAGMAMISQGIKPPIALGLIAGGLFLVQTEPLRMQIRDRELRVIAAQDQPEEVQKGELERLQREHQNLLLTNLGLTLAVAAYLLIF